MARYTEEQLLERWEDIHEIENLMGRKAFFTLLIRDEDVWNNFWCKKAEDPCLGFNNGYYKGYDALRGWFAATKKYSLLKAELAKKSHPDELGCKKADELLGVGALHVDNLTTPVIELAEDRKTAKGIWYVMDTSVDYTASGWGSNMSWGRIGVDFVKEDGWKLWHLVFAEDINIPTGTTWAVPQLEKPVDRAFAELGRFEFPKPSVPAKVHERFHAKRPLKPFPAVPQPYGTFSETFSYGI